MTRKQVLAVVVASVWVGMHAEHHHHEDPFQALFLHLLPSVLVFGHHPVEFEVPSFLHAFTLDSSGHATGKLAVTNLQVFQVAAVLLVLICFSGVSSHLRSGRGDVVSRLFSGFGLWIRDEMVFPVMGRNRGQQFLPFFENQSVDVAIIDTPWNGVWQSLKIAAAAEAYEVNVAPHNFYGHLCTMMNAHFSAVVPNLRIMETDIDRIAWDAEVFSHAPEYRDGYLVIPDRPGWGTEPVEAALKKYPPLPNVGLYHRTKNPQLSI